MWLDSQPDVSENIVPPPHRQSIEPGCCDVALIAPCIACLRGCVDTCVHTSGCTVTHSYTALAPEILCCRALASLRRGVGRDHRGEVRPLPPWVGASARGRRGALPRGRRASARPPFTHSPHWNENAFAQDKYIQREVTMIQ